MSVTIDQGIELRGFERRRDREVAAVTLITLYVFFLLAIPSRLIFAPLGGAGSPSTILGALFFVWYLLNWLHPSSRIGVGPSPMRRAGVLFLCAVLLSYVSATQHPLPVVQMNGVDRGIVLTCGWLGILFFTADGIRTMEGLQTLLRRIVFGATAMAVVGIVQFFTAVNYAQYITIPGLSILQPYSNVDTRDGLIRPQATALHPLEFGFVLAAILPLAIHQARYAPPGLRIRRWLQVALIAAVLPMTVSRTALLGTAICLLVILPTWPKQERRLAYLITLVSLFVLRIFIHGLIGTLRGLFTQLSSDPSAQSRTAAFHLAVPLISAHPWFGQGFGTFLPYQLFYTDDQYLNSLIEIGVVGLLVLLGLFVTGWCLARSARRASGDADVRDLMQCLAASVAIMAVGYTTIDVLYFPMAAGVTFLLLGCVGAAWRLVGHTRPDDEMPRLTLRPGTLRTGSTILDQLGILRKLPRQEPVRATEFWWAQ